MNRLVKKMMVVLLSVFMFMGAVTTPVQAKDTSNDTNWNWHWWWTQPAPEPTPTEEPVVDETPVETEEPVVEEPVVEEEEPVVEETPVVVEEPAEETPATEEPFVEEAPTETPAEIEMPEQNLKIEDETGMSVRVEIPEGSLPANVGLRARRVPVEDYLDKAEELLEGDVNVLFAVDITFYDENGIEIEPVEGKEVKVYITAPEISDAENLTIVHIPDEEEPETIEQIEIESETNELVFASDKFSVYLIVDGDEGLKKPRTTYHFLSEIKEDGTADPYTFVNKHGDYVDYQILKDDELLEDPGTPATSLERNFLGWFIVEKSGETYSFPVDGHAIDFAEQPPVKATTVTGDLDVYVAPRYGTAFIVTFWDNAKGSPEANMHIVAKKVVYLDENATGATVRVDDVNVPSAATEVHSGWTSDDYKTGEQTTYSLLEKPNWDGITNSFNLYPIFSEGHWLRFTGGPVGSGAGYRMAIFVTANTQASELTALGTVNREGYTFTGWYYDGYDGNDAATDANGNALNAADLLSRVQNAEGDTVLYGGWSGNQVTYKVATWFENADDDNEVFGTLTTHTGTAGTNTNVTANAVTGFTAQSIEQQVIKGDGTTIVNIHYKRNVYNIYFHSSRYNNQNNIIDALTITAKYGADIHNEWPGTREGTQDYGAAWYVATSGSTYVTSVTTMPVNGGNFYAMTSGRYNLNIIFHTQVVTGGNQFSQYLQTPYRGGNARTTADDYTHIDGFRVNAYSQTDANSIRNNATGDNDAVYDSNYNRSAQVGSYFVNNNNYENGRYTLHFYYLRNQYSVSFNTQKSAATTPAALTDIYYEANIATTKTAQIAALNQQYIPGETTVDVTGEGTYVFQGWYDNADGMGEPFNFDQKMPAGNITLYAKWERVYYLIEIDPRGGEILPDIDEVTYTWLQYGDKVEEYNIRRDYVEASDDYTGTRYYYVSVLADDDPNVNETSGYFTSDKRKGFYIETSNINSPQYSWWYENGFIDTSVEYMPATTNDNYAFVGWYNAANDKVYDFDAEVTGHTSIYARWRRSGLFNIQYHTENGTVRSLVNGQMVATDSSYADAATTKIAYTPTNITSTDGKAYVFKGWKVAHPYDHDNPTLLDHLYVQGDDFEVNASLADSGHYIHLVAVYEPAESDPNTPAVTTVTFDPNFPAGATGTTGVKTTIEGVPLNTAIDLSKDSFTIELPDADNREEAIPQFSSDRYELVGWNTKADGTGTAFKLNDIVGVDNLDPIDNTLYAIWDLKNFYIYHSGNGTLESVDLPADSAETFDLTLRVIDGYLYGGYYNAFGGYTVTEDDKAEADSAANRTYTVTGDTAVYNADKTYVKGLTKWWKNPVTSTPGTGILPEADAVYYIKEVPDTYLTTRIQYVYNWRDDYKLSEIYLLTAVDDKLYSSVFFNLVVNDETKKTAELAGSFTFVQKDSNVKVTTKVTEFAGVKRGFVGYANGGFATQTDGYIAPNTEFTITPCWVTPDGVTVTGFARKFTTGADGTKSTIAEIPLN